MGRLFSDLPPGHTEGPSCPACLALEQEIRQLRTRIQRQEAIYAGMGIQLPELPVRHSLVASN
jgi:hydrogenase maturation factor